MLNTEGIMYPTEDREYEIFDRVRRLRFTGKMIGKASTQREGGGPRWTDITIYVTEGGQYVIQREGISRVYHRATSACRGGEIVKNSDIDENSVPCRECRPPSIAELDRIQDEDDSVYRREVTMSSADVTSDPKQIISILTYQNRLTTVATEAITRAVANDPRLSGIFDQVETIA